MDVARAKTVTDLPAGINPRVRPLVEWLREHGLETTDSGDGATNAAGGMEETESLPHVHGVVEQQDAFETADRLWREMGEAGLKAHVEVSYSPEDRLCILSVYPEDLDETAAKIVQRSGGAAPRQDVVFVKDPVRAIREDRVLDDLWDLLNERSSPPDGPAAATTGRRER